MTTDAIDPFAIGTVTGAQWADAGKSAIQCVVTFPNHPYGVTDELPFMAVSSDTSAHGAALYKDLLAGKYGPIAAYTPDTTQLAANARIKRDELLAASDWTQLPDVPAATAEAWTTYRQALRDVPAQAGFPVTITWPVSP
jgi:hypothetical protein